MCGRYTLYAKKDVLEERFCAKAKEDFSPNHNVSPSQRMPVITSGNPEVIVLGQWGFLPEWAKGRTDTKPMINARAEGVESKPFFKEAFRKYRCLVLADGFYEWKRGAGTKIPYKVTLGDDKPFAMAGLYSEFENENGSRELSYTIITIPASKIIKPIHDRMPVIFKPEHEKKWLNLEQSFETLELLLLSSGPEGLIVHRE